MDKKNSKDNGNNNNRRNNEEDGMRRGRRSWGREEGRRNAQSEGLREDDSLGKRGGAASSSLEASRLAMAMALTGHNYSAYSSTAGSSVDHVGMDHHSKSLCTKGKGSEAAQQQLWGTVTSHHKMRSERKFSPSSKGPQSLMPLLERDQISATPDEDLPPAEPEMPIANRGRRPSLGQLF